MNNKNFPNFLHFLLILLLYVLFSIPFSLLVMAFPAKFKVLGMLIAYIFPLVLTIWSVRKIFDKRGKLNYKPGHFRLLPVVIAGAYAFLVVGEFFTLLLPEPTGFLKDIYDSLTESMKILFQDKISGFIMIAVAAPVLEETLFRGVILKSLLKKHQPWKAILYSAIAFGIFHLNPWQFLYATVVGIYLGYIYWKTKSLFYPILIHFMLNATSFVAGQYYDPDQNLEDILSAEYKTGFLLWVIIALTVIYFVYKYLDNYFSNEKPVFYMATGNSHKIDEINAILGNKIQTKSIKELGHNVDLYETGTTLEANALQKMRQISIPYDVDVIADDTGLEVEALDGAPGVYSARYAGNQATYQENVDKLLEKMRNKENRKARFRTIVAVSDGNKEKTFEGIINGKIIDEPRGDGGFGYDSIFVPDGYDKTFAEMTPEEKNKISHRAMALQKLKDYFEDNNKYN